MHIENFKELHERSTQEEFNIAQIERALKAITAHPLSKYLVDVVIFDDYWFPQTRNPRNTSLSKVTSTGWKHDKTFVKCGNLIQNPSSMEPKKMESSAGIILSVKYVSSFQIRKCAISSSIESLRN